MRTQNDELAIRRAIDHLSRACSTHGHHQDLFHALKVANPELAQKHWESLGRNAVTAGMALGLKVESNGAATTVLDAYLFGDSIATLSMVRTLSERLAKLSASGSAAGKSDAALASRQPKSIRRKTQ